MTWQEDAAGKPAAFLSHDASYNASALGSTGIAVSRLCFGTLTVGPLQSNLPPEDGGRVIAHAIERGISFFDTAQLYGTYAHLRRGMELSGRRDIVISSKTYAWNRELAIEAVEEARKGLDRDIVDIFMLHEQESALTLRGHREALEVLLEYRRRGVIRAVGASMHHIAAVRGAIELGLDVIHPLLNIAGLGIADGDRADMEDALREAHVKGIGIFSMKPLGGGNLFKKASECLDYILSQDYIDSVALGMQSIEEVDANLEYLANRRFSEKAAATLAGKDRRLHIDGWCAGCGKCAERCGQRAITVREGKAVCDHSRCVLCGYCAAVCPEWAIKVV
jgi:aryl-alcohol dehydrogenase-like predicted oxidoreductase/NAD-dependent dihydropyrimidine dehydrogenase PreA subunit